MTKQFYQIIETNDNEGEVWNFYVPLTEDEADHLDTVFACADESFQESFEFGNEAIAEAEIDILVKRGNGRSGYMPAHNKCSGTSLDILALPVGEETEELYDQLYKGGCWIKERG